MSGISSCVFVVVQAFVFCVEIYIDKSKYTHTLGISTALIGVSCYALMSGISSCVFVVVQVFVFCVEKTCPRVHICLYLYFSYIFINHFLNIFFLVTGESRKQQCTIILP
jgi:hypothetical protein